jgi:thiol-disulfide isomerase/thioredoxin
MIPTPTRRGLVAAAAVAAAVLITALTMLASRADRPQTITVAPPPPAAKPATGAIGDIVWHQERVAGPATEFQDGAGTATTLQAFQGRALVVNFWATWCAPCVEELPTLDSLQAILGGDQFRVLAISQDRDGAKVVAPFIDKNGWKNLAVYLEPQARFARDARLRGLPTTLILDKAGREAGRLEGTLNWTDPALVERLKALIAEPG